MSIYRQNGSPVSVPTSKVTFASKQGKTQQPPTLEQLKDIPDPKPTLRYNKRSVLLTLAGSLAALGTGYNIWGLWGDKTNLDRYHDWAKARVTEAKPGESMADAFWNEVAKVDASIQENRIIGETYDFFLLLYGLELALLGRAASLAVRRKSIKPEELYGVLNQMGLTGKDMKYAIIDDGALPLTEKQRQTMTFYTADNLDKPTKPTSVIGHGTAVNDLISRANPDAQAVVFYYVSHEDERKLSKEIRELLAKAKEDPEVITVDKVREWNRYNVKNVSNCIKKAVDEGAKAINMSLGFESWVYDRLIDEAHEYKFKKLRLEALLKLFPKSTSVHKKTTEELKKLLRYQAKLLSTALELKAENLDKEKLKVQYQPWFDALDYAYHHGVPVFVSSGNDGGHQHRGAKAAGNVDLLALHEHPALYHVASTDSDGVISHFTSEFNDETQPELAGNGSGEIQVDSKQTVGLLKKILNPFIHLRQRIAFEYASGTSIASPDVMSLYLKMKELDPTLTLEETRQVFKQAVGETRFDPAYETNLIKEAREAEIVVQFTELAKGVLARLKPFMEAETVEPGQVGQLEPVQSGIGQITFKVQGEILLLSFTSDNLSKQPKPMKLIIDKLPLAGKTLFKEPDNFALLLREGLLKDKTIAKELRDKLTQTVDIKGYLEKERRRRVGDGTLANGRHRAVYLTYQNKLRKQQASANNDQ